MKYTVLYIDDEGANLRVFKSLFRKDYNILTATSGKEGLSILAKEYCHLIVTDQIMPEMTGVEFLKEVYKKIPSVPPNRIILSGFTNTMDLEKAKNEFCLYKFIYKPFNVEELREIMRAAIREAY